MAFQLMWYETKLPEGVVDLMVSDLQNFDSDLELGKLGTNKNGGVNLDRRNNQATFIPGSHWIAGFCHHYISMANQNNFMYDIENFGHNVLQYSAYGPGEYYDWHVDTSIADNHSNEGRSAEENFIINQTEKVRKLSISVQLSSPEEYSGGEFQLLTDDNDSYFAPKERGTIIIFDSRMRHRVRKVNSGCRKSLVGWVVGPRWR